MFQASWSNISSLKSSNIICRSFFLHFPVPYPPCKIMNSALNSLRRYGLCMKTAQQYKMTYSLATTNNSNPVPLVQRSMVVIVPPNTSQNGHRSVAVNSSVRTSGSQHAEIFVWRCQHSTACWLSAAASARSNNIRAYVEFLMNPEFITFGDTLFNDVVSRSFITWNIFLAVCVRRRWMLKCKTRERGRLPGDVSRNPQLQQITYTFR